MVFLVSSLSMLPFRLVIVDAPFLLVLVDALSPPLSSKSPRYLYHIYSFTYALYCYLLSIDLCPDLYAIQRSMPLTLSVGVDGQEV